MAVLLPHCSVRIDERAGRVGRLALLGFFGGDLGALGGTGTINPPLFKYLKGDG
ncbi:hypothetical protein [Rhizobium ruizarguesonis]|uniref:hypothetical protein n=1 Tax=Rhizobium ruizarguesonis TaxID=2081791 RepID=UPI0013C19BDC|nr:hypothetical protein [Rhizobium ruizarguesonis]NEJ03335.1 hypothetical protein [Rhizobium ruizarguesonis]NEJ40520.1 hypothetical protein [Rhizobium ruizarguesonis]